MSPLATLTLARLYRAQGHPEAAVGVLRQLRQIDPANAEVLHELESVEKAWPSLGIAHSPLVRLKALNHEIGMLEEWLYRLE